MRMQLKRTDLYEAKDLAIVDYFHRHALLSECSENHSVLQLLMEYFHQCTYYINAIAI